MKKFIALGVSALSAATLIIGASPVKASEHEIIPQVCADMTDIIVESTAALELASNALGDAQDELGTTETALTEAITDYVLAFADRLRAEDSVEGYEVAVTQAALDAAGVAVGTAAQNWGQAKLDLFEAQHNFDLAKIVDGMNDTLNGSLCPAV